MSAAVAELPPREEIEREIALLGGELEDLTSSNSSVFFQPSPAQFPVLVQIDEVLEGKPKKIIAIYFFAGNGTGKTRLLKEIAVNLMLGPQNDFFDIPFFQNFPRPCRIRCTSTQKALDEGLIRELKDGLANHLKPGYPKKAGQTYESRFVTKNGSRLDLLTSNMAVTQHAGAACDAILKDEPMPKEISNEDDARLRHGGPVFHFLTPVDEDGMSPNVNWIFERIADADEGTYPDTYVVYSDCWENCKTTAKTVTVNGKKYELRGTVPEETVQSNYNRWAADSPATLQARFFGRHVRELGKVLTFWDKKRHVIPDHSLIPAPHWYRLAHLDVHPDKDDVLVYLYVTPMNQVIVYRELLLSGLVDENRKEILALYNQHGVPDIQLIDPLACTPNRVGGKTVMQTYNAGKTSIRFASAGLEKVDKTIGIDKIKALLKGIPDGMVDGKPRLKPLLFVSDACPYTIRQADRWMRNPKTGQPEKKHDDTWEGIYRLVLNIPMHGRATRREVMARGQRPNSSLVAPRRSR
jgi:hypothetical protein